MIEVKNLSKTYYNTNSEHVALSKLNFKLGNSGMVFLYGNSGEGKSTLLNVLSALDTYDDGGTIKYNGQDIKSMSQRERDRYRAEECGLVFEQDNLVPTLTVAENIRLARELKGQTVSDEEMSNIMNIIKLGGYEKRKISELSSGQAQRVALARVLIGNPKVLYVDEPTGHLDRQNAEMFWKIVKKQSKECLVVAITHERDIVNKYADRVLEIKDGKIIDDVYLSKELQEIDEKVFEFDKLDGYSSKKRRHSPKLSTRLRLGTKVLNSNKFKVASMVALMILTLVAFSLSYLLAAYNPNVVMAKSAAIQGLEYVTFEKDNGGEISNSDIQRLYNGQNSSVFYKVFAGDTVIRMGSQNNELYTAGGFMALSQVSSTTENALGQRILSGTYPSVTSKARSIAISDYVATLMSNHGIHVRVGTNPDAFTFYKNGTFASLLGKEIKIGKTYYKVSAVYDTDFEDFVNTKTFKPFSGIDRELYEYNLANVYGMIHTTEGCIQNVVNDVDTIVNVNMTLQTEVSAEILRTVNATRFSSSLVYNILGTKTTLSKGEVVLPLRLFNELFGASVVDYTDDSAISSAMSDSLITIGSMYKQSYNYTIVGVTPTDDIIFADSDESSEGYFGGVVQSNMYPTIKLASIFADENELATTISNFGSAGFKYTSMYSEEIEEVSEFISILRVALVVATVFIALFSMYFMFTFFATVIGNSRKTIGIYRSLGATFLTIISIYLITCFILMILSLVVSMLLSWGATAIVNSALLQSFGLPISILNIKFGMFFYMGLLALTMTAVGSIVPILIYCDKAPAEVIKR